MRDLRMVKEQEMLSDDDYDKVIKKSWEEYKKLQVKIDELETEIDRLRAIVGEDGEYDYDKCVGQFNRDLILMIKKESEERAKRVRVTNTYGFKNE
jgi:hypothetical protein